MRLSVAIVSHGHNVCLPGLLRGLNECLGPEDEVLILENLDPNPQFQLPNTKIRLLQNPEPRGLSQNLNRLLQLAHGEQTLIVNPDVRLPESLIPALFQHHKRRRGVLLGARSAGHTGLWASLRAWPSPLNLIADRVFFPSRRHAVQQNLCQHNQTFWIQGSLLFGFTDEIRQIGFDERFFLYLEDTDFCWRWWEAGHRIEVLQHPVYFHSFARSSSKRLDFALLHLQSMFKFFLKHPRCLIHSVGPTTSKEA